MNEIWPRYYMNHNFPVVQDKEKVYILETKSMKDVKKKSGRADRRFLIWLIVFAFMIGWGSMILIATILF